MLLSKSLFIFSSLASIVFIMACAQTDTDKIRDAQACLDTATAATAGNCAAKVNGLSSAASMLIRCSAIMIRQGMTNPTKLSSIISAMQSSSNPNGTALSVMSFSYYGSAADTTDSTNASTYCYLSGSSGLNTLAFMSSIATAAAGGGASTPSQFKSYANSNASTIANTGNNAQMMYTSYQQNCTGNNSAYQSFCSQYSAAITASGGSSNPTTVATSFLTNLN